MEYSEKKDSEAKALFGGEECCDGLVMSAMGTGVGCSHACHVFPSLYRCGDYVPEKGRDVPRISQ